MPWIFTLTTVSDVIPKQTTGTMKTIQIQNYIQQCLYDEQGDKFM